MSDARGIVQRVLQLAKGSECSVALTESRTGSTRFAVNQITSSSDVGRVALEVTIQVGQRAASATTNQLDDRSLVAVVARAQRFAALVPENPELQPVLGAQRYAAVSHAADPATIALGPDTRAKAAAAAIAAGARAATMAGFYEHADATHTLATSRGLFAQHHVTQASFSCTARTPDATGSGWAGAASNRAGDLDAGALAKIAVGKAVTSVKPRRLEPGRYTVILEPTAVGELLGFFTGSLDARPADEGRSYFTNHKVGDKLFGDAISLRTLPQDPLLGASPYDSEGQPRAATTWVDKGVLKALTYDRFWAKKQGTPPTAQPAGWQLDGGTATRDQLIQGVKRGVLITRFWYANVLDPMTLLATGLTRDGTFLIEDGHVVGPVNNFRFNESPIQMLAKCDGLTPGVLTVDQQRMPTLRTHEFNLASISEAV